MGLLECFRLRHMAAAFWFNLVTVPKGNFVTLTVPFQSFDPSLALRLLEITLALVCYLIFLNCLLVKLIGLPKTLKILAQSFLTLDDRCSCLEA